MIEMIVVIKNFLNICGLLGAPVSLPPSTIFSAVSLIFKGRTIKSNNHHINKNRIIDPAIPNVKLLLAQLKCHYSLWDAGTQQAYHVHQF